MNICYTYSIQHDRMDRKQKKIRDSKIMKSVDQLSRFKANHHKFESISQYIDMFSFVFISFK